MLFNHLSKQLYSIQIQNKTHIKKKIHQIFNSFQSPKISNFFTQKFKLHPHLFSKHYFNLFLKSNNINSYINYISNKTSQPPNQHKNPLEIQMFRISEKFYYSKPYIQAYLDYLYTYHQSQILKSKLLFQLADAKQPYFWFPQTRKLKRKIIYHHGSTNSGKTTYALKQLKKAKTGLYLAPLRLLAWQVQQQLLPCNLITGQQKIMMQSNITSCTIQIADFNKQYDVVVIDQIQMIGDLQRGWAWTQALLRIRALNIHICGDNRALKIVKKLIQRIGDDFQEKQYKRLSNLKLLSRQFDILKDLREGDCIIAFTVNKLYQLRKLINIHYQIKKNPQRNLVAIVYGKLPSELRKMQSELFNSGQVPYLVATNAIGMGLNFKIKRIIFYSVYKTNFEGQVKKIQNYEIQQIAGRAGRSNQNGQVLTTNKKDYLIVRRALRNVNRKDGEAHKQNEDIEQENIKEVEQIKKQQYKIESEVKSIGLFFSYNIIQRFRYQLQQVQKKQYQLSEIFQKFVQFSQISQQFFIQNNHNFYYLSRKIQHIGLQFKDQYTFCMVPIFSTKKQIIIKSFIQYAQSFKDNHEVKIPKFIIQDFKNNYKKVVREDQIEYLQMSSNILEMYIWLASKFEMAFSELFFAVKIKYEICSKIHKLLYNEQLQTDGKFLTKQQQKSELQNLEAVD